MISACFHMEGRIAQLRFAEDEGPFDDSAVDALVGGRIEQTDLSLFSDAVAMVGSAVRSRIQ